MRTAHGCRHFDFVRRRLDSVAPIVQRTPFLNTAEKSFHGVPKVRKERKKPIKQPKPVQ